MDPCMGSGHFEREAFDILAAIYRKQHPEMDARAVEPLQKAGLLAGDVLNKKDLDKAIADRARWRSDERRWVRAGKLPRCGWMDESVPESPRWTELTPERDVERRRLEEKRKAVLIQK